MEHGSDRVQSGLFRRGRDLHLHAAGGRGVGVEIRDSILDAIEHVLEGGAVGEGEVVVAEVGEEEAALPDLAAPGDGHVHVGGGFAEELGGLLLVLDGLAGLRLGEIEAEEDSQFLAALEALGFIPVDLVLVPEALAPEGGVERMLGVLDLECPGASGFSRGSVDDAGDEGVALLPHV